MTNFGSKFCFWEYLFENNITLYVEATFQVIVILLDVS